MTEVDIDELNNFLAEGSALPPQVDEVPQETNDEGHKKDKEHKKKKKKDKKHKRHRHEKHESEEDASGDDDEEDDLDDFVVNSDDDDDEDEEGTDQETKKKKKKKKSKRHREERGAKRSRFIDAEAEGSDGEDDDDGSEEEGYKDILDRYPEPPAAARQPLFDFENDDDIDKHYEEKVNYLKQRRDREAELTPAQRASLLFDPRTLPRESDPKVFSVKCIPDMGPTLVSRIVNKCYAYRIGDNYENKKIDLGIISVFALDHIREYIYIEAYRKTFVENALNGLNSLFRGSIAVVEPADLIKMMERRPSNDRIRVGSFVRLRPKQYRDDLAQVIALGRDGQHLTLKFVPRENFAGRTYEKQDRPCPQRLFVPTLALGVVETGERYRWGPLEFDLDGYLIKTVTVRSVIHGHTMPPPTTDELAVFYDNHRERVREAIQKYTLQNVDTGIFSIGDSVRITSGQLKGTIGTIRSITGDGTAQIACQVPGRQEPLLLKVELKLCSKHIVEGTHVVVQSGEHQGISGTVVRAAGEDILLFPDNNDFVKEVLVRAMDCHESKLSGTARHTHGIHQLFDLVSYNGTPACIIGLNMKLLQILTDQNEPKTVTYAQVRPTVKANMRRSLDSMNNVIVRGVEVLFQPHPDTPSDLVGEMGRVEQVFNETAFVRSQKLSKYSGIVSVRSECLLLTTGRTTHRRAAPRAELPRPDRRPHNAIRAEISVQPASTAWSQSQPHE